MTLVTLLITLICLLTKNPKLEIANKNIKTKLFWPIALRFIFESYLEFTICVTLNVMNLQWSNVNPSVSYSSILSLTFIAALILILSITLYFFCYVSKLEDEAFSKKYGTLHDGLKFSKEENKRLSAIAHPFLFIVRRLIFVFFIIRMENIVWSQITLQFACCIFMIIYLGHIWPF